MRILRRCRVTDDGKCIEPMYSEAAEPSDRHDARERNVRPAAGVRTQGRRPRQDWRQKHIAVKQQAIGTASEPDREPGPSRKADKCPALAALCRSQLTDKVRKVVVDLSDVIDVLCMRLLH